MIDSKQVICGGAIVFNGLSTLCCSLALSLNNWHERGIFHFGLWKQYGLDICFSFTIFPGWLVAFRTFAILGLFLIIRAAFSSCVYAWEMQNNALVVISIVCSIGSGFSMGMAIGIFSRYVTTGYGIGSSICIAACVLGWYMAFLNALLVCLIRKAPEHTHDQEQ